MRILSPVVSASPSAFFSRLLSEGWECLTTRAGAYATPAALIADGWLAAPVPGTVASAWREAGKLDLETLRTNSDGDEVVIYLGQRKLLKRPYYVRGLGHALIKARVLPVANWAKSDRDGSASHHIEPELRDPVLDRLSIAAAKRETGFHSNADQSKVQFIEASSGLGSLLRLWPLRFGEDL